MTNVCSPAKDNSTIGSTLILRLPQSLYKAAWLGFGHSIFSMAKSAAYSAILSIFPALLVLTTSFALAPSVDTVRGALGTFLAQILPPDTMQLVQAYCQSNHARSMHLERNPSNSAHSACIQGGFSLMKKPLERRASGYANSNSAIVWAATLVSISGAMGVIFSLMEGFRHAYWLPRGVWGWWKEPVVAFLLVPATLIPEAGATLLLIFGHSMERWMILNSDQRFHLYVVILWRAIRWIIALIASVTVLMVVYYFGVPRQQDSIQPIRANSGRHSIRPLATLTLTRHQMPPSWRAVLPGALLATAAWFMTTLLYGVYLSRFSDQSIVYGSLSAAVVTLVWLYMISLCILIGAEFNAQFSSTSEEN
jgi:membrane protein